MGKTLSEKILSMKDANEYNDAEYLNINERGHNNWQHSEMEVNHTNRRINKTEKAGTGREVEQGG